MSAFASPFAGRRLLKPGPWPLDPRHEQIALELGSRPSCVVGRWWTDRHLLLSVDPPFDRATDLEIECACTGRCEPEFDRHDRAAPLLGHAAPASPSLEERLLRTVATMQAAPIAGAAVVGAEEFRAAGGLIGRWVTTESGDRLAVQARYLDAITARCAPDAWGVFAGHSMSPVVALHGGERVAFVMPFRTPDGVVPIGEPGHAS